MLPIVKVPFTIAEGMKKYREIFFRDKGFEHVSRYMSGLVLSANKTLQGIYAQQVWPEGESVSRRAMHAAVFDAGWSVEELMKKHRANVSLDHQGNKGREIISLDWTMSHHDRGPRIYGVKEAYEYVERRMSLFQTVITATISNPLVVDGIAVEVQKPDYSEAEIGYLEMTKPDEYMQIEEAGKRIMELISYYRNQLSYKKRTELLLEVVQLLESENQFPKTDYAFDNGVLTLDLTRFIESKGKHWVSEIESSRNINWQGQWRRVDEVDADLRTQHPESYRSVDVKGRNGEIRYYWIFTKVVRLKRYGRKRLLIIHEEKDLKDAARFLLTDALHWESRRVLEVWSYRWTSEIFHEFSKQVTGFESAQVRNEESVKRHFCLSCVAQSLVQRSVPGGGKSERFEFADGKATVGQRVYTIAREALTGVLMFAQGMFSQGRSCGEVMSVLMPS